ncbi:hypothetical protein AB0L33_18420 [Streptomyces sp. NPDC052299]|uniref:hypothetical protein n=1 Tax=Streptomyces sp. NPDC052299 TaxID=3155054 RepID=UPI00341A1144
MPKNLSSDLIAFAQAVPGQMPGWSAQVHTLTKPNAFRAQLWDQLVLDGLLKDSAVTDIVVLTGPDHDRFIAVPGDAALLLGALRPPDPTETLDITHLTAPTLKGLDPDPVRAVADVKEKYLPDYERSLRRIQIQALGKAAAGLARVTADWDDISGTLCDAAGWPIDDTVYADGKVARDTAAWTHVETFLAHGPHVLAHIRSTVTQRDFECGPVSTDLRRIGMIDTTLEEAQRIQTEWEQVISLMDGSLPGSRALYEDEALEVRNSEGWHYADELREQGPALVRVAGHFADRADAEHRAENLRQAAALHRSAPDAYTVPTASPAVPPTSPPAPRRGR